MFEKIKFTENRRLAWSVFTAVVLLSIILSGGGALKEKRSDVLNIYYHGESGSGLCIDYDMDARLDCAYNLAGTAGRYDAIDSAKITAVSDACAGVEAVADGDIAAVSAQNELLTRAVEDLYSELDNATLSASDKTFALSQYKEFGSRALTISRDSYNTYAEEFNALIVSFPASVVARVAQVESLGLFR